VAAVCLLTAAPGAAVAERHHIDIPLVDGHTPWDFSPNAATSRPSPRPTPDSKETEVLLLDWQYTSFPISHWRQ
jgi:hypothetical protein